MVELGRIRELLLTVCPCEPEEITKDKHLVRDLDIDSFGLMELVLDFEKEFGISIPDRDLRKFETVADIMAYIDQKQRVEGGRMAHAAT